MSRPGGFSRFILPLLLLPLLPRAAAAQDPLARTTLVVFITVDQMRGDYLDRFGAQLTGGLARLKTGGAVFANASLDYAITETAPGHATGMSGRFPRSTGIFSNSLGVYDPQAPSIGGGAAPASPFRFRGSTLIDWMRSRNPQSRALSVSRKDRGAILPMGRAQQEVYWYASDGRFTTSTYYADTLPAWVRQFNARRLPHQYAGKAWTPLLPASEYPEPDSVTVENRGQGIVFPHVAPADSALAARVLPNYPWMDQLTLDFALEGLRQLDLGQGPAVDLLAISLSTTDAVGHAFGPDSRELHDQILRLDRALGAFFDRLFQIRDSAGVIVALTADHGVTPFPEVYSARTGRPAGQVDLSGVAGIVRARILARGVDSSAWQWEDGVLWMDRGAFTRAGVSADFAVREFMTAARENPGVLRVDQVRSLAQQDTSRDYVSRRWLHMIPPELPVEVVVTLKEHYVWGPASYAMHGSPHDDDARVPIMLYGAPFKPGAYRDNARVVDLAPTLAAVLGVAPTERVDGRVLRAALRSAGTN